MPSAMQHQVQSKSLVAVTDLIRTTKPVGGRLTMGHFLDLNTIYLNLDP